MTKRTAAESAAYRREQKAKKKGSKQPSKAAAETNRWGIKRARLNRDRP